MLYLGWGTRVSQQKSWMHLLYVWFGLTCTFPFQLFAWRLYIRIQVSFILLLDWGVPVLHDFSNRIHCSQFYGNSLSAGFSRAGGVGGKPHATKNIFVFVWISWSLEEIHFYLHLPDLVGPFHFIKTRFSSLSKRWCCLASEWPGTHPCIRR